MGHDLRHPRFPITLFIGKGEDSIPLGRSRDISMSGVFVETVKRPAIGSEEEIWFVWGEDILTLRARVARHGPDGVGLEFLKPEAFVLQAIKEMTGGPTVPGETEEQEAPAPLDDADTVSDESPIGGK